MSDPFWDRVRDSNLGINDNRKRRSYKHPGVVVDKSPPEPALEITVQDELPVHITRNSAPAPVDISYILALLVAFVGIFFIIFILPIDTVLQEIGLLLALLIVVVAIKR